MQRVPHSLYRVIRKSLQDFRPLQYSSRDGHAEEEHVNRGRDTPSLCPILQVLDMSNLGDAAKCQNCNQVPATPIAHVWQEPDYRIDICRDTKGGHIEHLNGRTETWSVSPSVDMHPCNQVQSSSCTPVIKSLPHMCNVCGRNLITGLTSAASPRVDI